MVEPLYIINFTRRLEMEHINSIEQLMRVDYLLRSISIGSGMPDYQFIIPELSESTNHEVSQLMNNYKNECGCFTGGLFMGLSVISVISYYLISSQRVSDIDLKHIIFSTGFIIGSALLGKIVGLLWARFRMIQLVQKTLLLAQRRVNGLITKEE